MNFTCDWISLVIEFHLWLNFTCDSFGQRMLDLLEDILCLYFVKYEVIFISKEIVLQYHIYPENFSHYKEND